MAEKSLHITTFVYSLKSIRQGPQLGDNVPDSIFDYFNKYGTFLKVNFIQAKMFIKNYSCLSRPQSCNNNSINKIQKKHKYIVFLNAYN